jgi:chromosome segregation ATPase
MIPLAVVHGQEAAEDPQAAANAKLRAALRDMTLQLRTAQTEAAQAKADRTAADEKIADLTKKSEALAKQASQDQADSKKSIEKLTVDYQELEKKYATLDQALAKWKEGYAKAAAVANAKEAERSKLADEKSVLQAKVRDHKSQNLELYRVATEILERYRSFSMGDALKAREPFTGITKARLDSQVQDYRDKVEDARIPAEGEKKKPTP